MSRGSSKFQRVVVSVGLVVLGALVVTACQQGASPTAPAAVEQSGWQSKNGPQNENKALVCHQGTNGPETLEVSENAVEAHLAHGDSLGACGAAVECSCYTAQQLQDAAFSDATSCYFDDPMGGLVGGRVEIKDASFNTVQNLSTSSFGFTCGLLDIANGVNININNLSEEDWNACNALVEAEIVQLGLTTICP